MATNPELEARILSNPDDKAAYAVYGDWLSERGDPRGELVAVQLRLAESDDAALREREAKLLADHAGDWLGELAPLQAGKEFAVTWRYGFLHSVRVGPPTEDYETGELDLVDALTKLVRLPNIALLHELVIGSKEADDQPSWQDEIDALANHGVPAGLRRLVIDTGGYWDISWTELGDVSPLYPQLRGLRELRLHGAGIALGTIDLPELRKLEIITGSLQSENLTSIRTGKLPKLETLTLYIGETDGDHGCTVELDDLMWIFAGEGLAGVKHLGLANSSLADEIAQHIVSSKILRQLRTLDLSHGTLGDAGAQTILDHADAFAHLEKLDLTRSFISPELVSKLSRLKGPQVILADMETPDDDWRYVAISE
ncbi:MAG TPA: TIGR02996 domain-containing protein [Kofleriaceae bacterium]|nr:TIGR02996 domain-containing protein [Kofleriaceae bacterium]